jgi:hypothetical protein
VKLFSAQRRREATKLLQFLELMKAMFNCGGNTRQQSAGVRHHEGNSLDPRKDDFLKLMMQSSHFLRETQDWIKVIKKARSLNIPRSHFKASKGWAIRFMRQIGLAMQHRTTICQKKCCISNALDASEDDIVWEDDVEDKDDSDWVESTDNVSVMSDYAKSDE